MLRKGIFAITILFLLFEVLYFQSNSLVLDMEKRKDQNQIYRVALDEGREDFLNLYQDIILEDENTSVVVLTSSTIVEEIQKNYSITVEN